MRTNSVGIWDWNPPSPLLCQSLNSVFCLYSPSKCSPLPGGGGGGGGGVITGNQSRSPLSLGRFPSCSILSSPLFPRASITEENFVGRDDDDAGGIETEIEEIGTNRRKIRSKVLVRASLQIVWNILTDYETLAHLIPGLVVSQLLDKKDNFARIFQIGQQNLPFGLKFKAKGVIDCYEKDLEILPSGLKRDIEFKMIEGDFQLFEGKWSVEQINRGKKERNDTFSTEDFYTTLSYVVDVEPKVWLPVRLVQGRLCSEIKLNLSCIQSAAEREFGAGLLSEGLF